MEKQNDNSISLPGKFPAVSTRQWEEKIREDLQGADYERKLVWETHDGYRIRPYYRREDLGGIGWLDSQPGDYPYLRGTRKNDNGWLIRQDIPVDDPAAAGEYARELISRGATALGFDLTAAADFKEKDLHSLLSGISPGEVHLNFICDGHYHEVLEWLASFIQKNNPGNGKSGSAGKGTAGNVKSGSGPAGNEKPGTGNPVSGTGLAGSISGDPLGRLTSTGAYRSDMYTAFIELGSCLEYAGKHLPGFRVVHAGGDVFHDAGASITQELAFTLAMGNEYLVQLNGTNYGTGDILAGMQFSFSTGSGYFMEIAKLRAARYLWSGILEAHSGSAGKLPPMFIQSRTSRWNQTLYDPHVNLLRGNTEAMSAILGGTDVLTVTPFDQPAGKPVRFADRVARNSQIILKEESYLDKVIDPAAGSYYIENLTYTLIEGAWELFLETEKKGGYIKSLESGFIQEQVREVASARLSGYSTRRDMLLGTNQFPIFDEKSSRVPGKEGKPSATDAASSGSRDNKPTGARGGKPEEKSANATKSQDGQMIIDPLLPFRGAEEFETLRLKTENHPGKQPLVFIIPLGNLAMRRARAMFTMNFFAVAGFRVIDNIGKFGKVPQGIEAAKKEGADIVVLCSSDEEYPAMAAGFATAASQGMIPVIAGYPKEHMDSLKNAGISHFIHLRSNVLEELKNYQAMLGI